MPTFDSTFPLVLTAIPLSCRRDLFAHGVKNREIVTCVSAISSLYATLLLHAAVRKKTVYVWTQNRNQGRQENKENWNWPFLALPPCFIPPSVFRYAFSLRIPNFAHFSVISYSSESLVFLFTETRLVKYPSSPTCLLLEPPGHSCPTPSIYLIFSYLL